MIRTAYMVFGRFQPPTSGHATLLTDLKMQADKVAAEHFVIPTQSQTKPPKRIMDCKERSEKVENPLNIDQK